MNKLELQEKLVNLRQELQDTITNGETEQRELNETETSRLEELRQEIASVEDEIRTLDEENARIAQQQTITENKNEKRNMVKLVNLINGIVEGRSLNENEAQFVNRNTINLRSVINAGTATEGQEVIPEDKMGLDVAIRNASVLNRLGATWFSNAKGDISIPKYAGSSVTWKGEVAEADHGEGAFSEVVLTPKRLTAIVDISKQFLLQSADEVEGLLISDLASAVAEKLDKTVFSTSAGTTTMPAGLFSNTAITVTGTDLSAVTYNDILELESLVEEKNGYDIKFVANPRVKYTLKGTDKASGYGQMVFADGEIDGYQTIVSNSVAEGGLVALDPRDLAVAVWSDADIVVDTVSRAQFGEVRLVINYYVDAALRGDRIACEIFD